MSRVHNVLALFALLALAGAANAATTPEGVAYLQANKLKDGVIELPSGLQYRVLVEGPAGDRARAPPPAAPATTAAPRSTGRSSTRPTSAASPPSSRPTRSSPAGPRRCNS